MKKIRFNKTVVKALLKAALGDVAKDALRIVADVAQEDLSGGRKRQKAVRLLKQAAKEKGVELRTSLIYLAIELAVQALTK